jgi:hypothetical protein
MQAEQTNTQQTKKTVVKKVVKKVKETEQQQSEPVSQQQVEVQTTAPVVDVTTTTNEQTTQDFDVNTVLEFLNTTSDKLTDYVKFFKDTTFSKDDRSKVETGFKKFYKSTGLLQTTYTDNLSKQVSLLEKNGGGKSKAKSVTDKEKSAIHKKLNVQPFLLKFMNLEQGTMVSRSDALSSITSYVKEQKEKNPNIIAENDKRSFKLIGELKPLFDGIFHVMESKGQKLESIPQQIKYTQIMQYMTHCFVKDDASTPVV